MAGEAYRTGVPPSEVAVEAPLTPGQAVGIPAGTVTGPYLLVFAIGKWTAGSPTDAVPWLVDLTAASLTGPDGAVAVRTLDRGTPQYGSYLPPGGAVVIPVSPLRAGARYTASVTMSNAWDTLTRTWSFTTGSASGTTGGGASGASVQIVDLTTGALTVSYRAPGPHAVLTVSSAGRLVARHTLTQASGRLRVRLPRSAVLSRLRACVAGAGTARSWESTR